MIPLVSNLSVPSSVVVCVSPPWACCPKLLPQACASLCHGHVVPSRRPKLVLFKSMLQSDYRASKQGLPLRGAARQHSSAVVGAVMQHSLHCKSDGARRAKHRCCNATLVSAIGVASGMGHDATGGTGAAMLPHRWCWCYDATLPRHAHRRHRCFNKTSSALPVRRCSTPDARERRHWCSNASRRLCEAALPTLQAGVAATASNDAAWRRGCCMAGGEVMWPTACRDWGGAGAVSDRLF